MKSLLTALEEGRLVELPDPNKNKALEFLALLIEAIPDIQTKADIVKAVMTRETSASTALGKGVACPHARIPGEGDLVCAIGWSPQGIDYGAPDGQKVHMVIMYCIPDSQRSYYLKEISGLAKALMMREGIQSLSEATDIHAVRNQLLDWASYAIDAAIPDAKARMIRLQEKQAVAHLAEPGKGKPVILSFSVLLNGEAPPIILARDADFVRLAEAQTELTALLKKSEQFDLAGYQILIRSVSSFFGDRLLHDCIAIRLS